MTILASYSEPKNIISAIRAQSSPLPDEEYGCDFLWMTDHGWAGIQRKQFPHDFFASIPDGRLAKEMEQIQQVSLRMLLLEGRPSFNVQGHLLWSGANHSNRRISREQIQTMLWNLQNSHGVQIQWTVDHQDTIRTIKNWHFWTGQASHGQCMRPTKSVNWLEWMLQGIPKIGPVGAKTITEHCSTPLQWTIDPASIPGLNVLQIANMKMVIP